MNKAKECGTCGESIRMDDHGTWIDSTGGDVCPDQEGSDGFFEDGEHYPAMIREMPQ